jgi:hypothetical protein
MIAISYLEWIRWMATGRLRCTGRLAALRGFDDQAGFDALLCRAPDLNFEDEQGFLIAVLRPDTLQAVCPVQSGSGLESVWMPINCVAAFYPVTERGQRLLEADAARANVRLEKPLFADLWVRWQRARREEAGQHRSEMLCAALGLPMPSLDRVSSPVVDLLMGRTVPSTADKAAQLRGSSAYAWALTFGVFGDTVGEDAKKALSKQWGLGELLKRLERGYPIGKPVTGSEAVKVTREMSRHLHESSRGEISVLLLATVFHYQHLLTSDRPVSLESMLEDFFELGADGGVEFAALAGYVIAPFMDDVAVSTLMYQAKPSSFLAMEPTKLPVSIDVGGRIHQHRSTSRVGALVQGGKVVSDSQPSPTPDNEDEISTSDVESKTIEDLMETEKSDSGASSNNPEASEPSADCQFLNNQPKQDSGRSADDASVASNAEEVRDSTPKVQPDPIHGQEVLGPQNLEAFASTAVSSISLADQPEESAGPDGTRSA